MNLELVENIVALISEFPVSEIEVTLEGQRVYARRPLVASSPVPAAVQTSLPLPPTIDQAEIDPFPALTADAAMEARTLIALRVGIFHQAEPPLPYAANVQPGQVVGYIESMKLMNDVVAEEGGHVIEVLVEDGAPVEYGQALFRLTA